MEFSLVYFPALHYNKNCNITLQHWMSKSFFKGMQGSVWGLKGGGRREGGRRTDGVWSLVSLAVFSSNRGPSLLFLMFRADF